MNLEIHRDCEAHENSPFTPFPPLLGAKRGFTVIFYLKTDENEITIHIALQKHHVSLYINMTNSY